jgi:hypothetical protein
MTINKSAQEFFRLQFPKCSGLVNSSSGALFSASEKLRMLTAGMQENPDR